MASSKSNANMFDAEAEEAREEEEDEDQDAMLDAAEAEEEIPLDDDHPMDGQDENDLQTEIQLQNDSVAHFDGHSDSIFCIAAHPLDSSIIATGSGDDTAHIFSTTAASPLLPASYESNPQPGPRESLQSLAHLTGHTDSVNAIAFTLPRGDYLLTAGLDGQLRAYKSALSPLAPSFSFHASVREVEEINWLASCPHPSHPDTIALGASDNSVWIYTVDADPVVGLTIRQVYTLHQGPCTAGAWSPNGSLLATVAEDSSFHVYDPFGAAIAGTSQALISLTAADQRFGVEGGLFSVAIAPSGTFAAVGGADGTIRIVGLPLLSPAPSPHAAVKTSKASKAASKAPTTVATSQAGQILATLHVQTDSIESLAFATSPLALLAAGSVDGSVVVFDTAHRFAVRRHLRSVHDDEAIVKVEFVPVARGTGAGAGAGAGAAGSSAAAVAGAAALGHVLTTCGVDGVVRKWDTRGATTTGGPGLLGEWLGHGSGGVLGFVQDGQRVVTAGDDGVALVFDAITAA